MTTSGPKAARGKDRLLVVKAVLSVETRKMLNQLATRAGVSRSAILRGLIQKEFQKGHRQ